MDGFGRIGLNSVQRAGVVATSQPSNSWGALGENKQPVDDGTRTRGST